MLALFKSVIHLIGVVVNVVGLPLFKITVYIVGVASLALVAGVFISGIELARQKREEGIRDLILDWHRDCTKYLLGLTIIALPVVEIFARILPQLRHHPPIFTVHIRFFAPEYLISLGLIYIWFNGSKFPRFHRWLARPCVVWCVGTNVLGMYMGHLLPWH